MSWRISSAYRKPETCWQHHPPLNGGMTYSKRARTRSGRIRIRRIRVAGLLIVIGAIAAALGYQMPGPSSSSATSPLDILRSEDRSAVDDAPPTTVWPAQGQAAFI